MTSEFFNKLALLKDHWFFRILKMKSHLPENIYSPHLQVCCLVTSVHISLKNKGSYFYGYFIVYYKIILFYFNHIDIDIGI